MWSNVGGVTLQHSCDDIGELCKVWKDQGWSPARLQLHVIIPTDSI